MRLRLGLVLLLIGLVPALGTFAATQVPASDARIVYEGRFDTSNREAPVVIWQASRIRIDFEGDALRLNFGEVKGQVFFDAALDGVVSMVELREGQAVQGASWTSLGAGRHRLVLFKRSEANAGTVAFSGVELADTAQMFPATVPAYAFKLLFIGDSITVGACNQDGADDQWQDRRTHNTALSYATFTANAFKADYRNIAVSGMGVAEGWVKPLAGEVWDRIYPAGTSARGDLTGWQPAVVLINLGENDASFAQAQGRPFSSDYRPRFRALVQAVRTAYPEAHIVLLRGGMFGGAQNPALRAAWTALVTELEATDKKVSHFVFDHWSPKHPRVGDDRIMAEELTAWLRKQSFMPTATNSP